MKFSHNHAQWAAENNRIWHVINAGGVDSIGLESLTKETLKRHLFVSAEILDQQLAEIKRLRGWLEMFAKNNNTPSAFAHSALSGDQLPSPQFLEPTIDVIIPDNCS